MRIFEIPIELYDTKVEILNNVTDEEFNEYFLVNFDQTPTRTMSTAACWTVNGLDNKEHYVLDFKKKLKKDLYSLNTISHECLHATFEILKKISIPYQYNVTDEVFCCLNAFIFEKVYEKLFIKE